MPGGEGDRPSLPSEVAALLFPPIAVVCAHGGPLPTMAGMLRRYFLVAFVMLIIIVRARGLFARGMRGLVNRSLRVSRASRI